MAEIQTGLVALKDALSTESVKQKFNDLLGKKAAGFTTNILNVVSNNALLQKADRNSIIVAAAQAATMDLSINPNLGLAALVPFKDKSGMYQAQMQIMRDGWVELCLRSGEFEYIVNEPVYEGELVEHNRFTDTYVFDETKRSGDKIIGYMAAFKLTNGYKKCVYWDTKQCLEHGKRYSKSFDNATGLWKTNPEAMCLKTVLKHLLKKYAPKSIEKINFAMAADQAVFSGDIDNPIVSYPDNPNNTTKTEPVDFQEAQVVTEEKLQ